MFMDFAMLPPEVNSTRMYSGPGAGVLLRTERLKSQRVAGAVMQVISRSEYRQAAARLADAFGRDRVGFPQHVENALRLMPENRPRTWLAS